MVSQKAYDMAICNNANFWTLQLFWYPTIYASFESFLREKAFCVLSL
jgi:hypothetical protein